MSDEFIECWNCNMPVTLAERGDEDGFCPHCMCELDLDDYLCQSIATINQLRAELAAIKAQEPVEYQQWSRYENWDRVDKAVFELGLLSSTPERFRALYAAPVSEAKAQGVVMPERMSEEAASTIRGMVDYCLNQRVCMGMDEGFKSFDPEVEHDFVREVRAFAEGQSSLNASPVQQVSVPDGWKHGLPPEGEICEARIPHHTADGRQMIWCEVEVIAHSIINGAIYSWVKETGRDGSFYAPMMLSFRKLAAAPAVPAADAGLVEFLADIERISDDYHADNIEDADVALDEMREALCAALAGLAAHSAKGGV